MKNTNILSTLAVLLLFTSSFLISCDKAPVDNIHDPLRDDEYFLFSIGGLQNAFSTPADSLGAFRTGTTTTFYGYEKGQDTYLTMSFVGDATAGNYNVSQVSLHAAGKDFVPVATTPTVFVSNYGVQGLHVEGSYQGQLKDTLSGIVYSFNGVFKIRRKN